MKIVTASAKVRTGGPGEDRKDEKDASVRGRYWTGVVPVHMQYGKPADAVNNKVGLPEYISKWVSTNNVDGEELAHKALQESAKAK